MPRPDDRRVALEAWPQSRSAAETKGEERRPGNESECDKFVYENLYHKRSLETFPTAFLNPLALTVITCFGDTARQLQIAPQ